MTLARERGWTPAEVDDCPAAFIDEVFAEMNARADHELFSIKDGTPEVRKQQAQRRSEIVKWRKAERDEH